MNSTPQATLTTLLRAFERLDLDGMMACFADQAIAFFPAEHQRRRLQGKEAIRHAFASILAWLQVKGIKNLQLAPEDLYVQDGGNIAVASFHLPGEPLGRRTMVLCRQGKRWEIIHLHASNAPDED